MNDTNQMRGKARAAHGKLMRRLLVQYFAALVAFVLLLAVFIFAGWVVCGMVTWQGDEPLYRILSVFRNDISFFSGLIILAGWAVITVYFFSKPLRFLDELAAAASQLGSPQPQPIVLSDELKDVQDELNRAREQALNNAAAAKEAEQRKNDLVVYLAHDLKTPLTSIIGYLTLLRDEPQISAELRARYTGIAYEKALRLEDLINEFFDITRFNLSHLELTLCPVNLARMLQQVASEFEPVLAQNSLTSKVEVPQSLPCECDPDKLARVFDNLLRNACYYSLPGTELQISAKMQGQNAVLQFTNTGKTIPPEKLGRIFEQFFRLDSARSSDTGGAGLGLAISREIVELHGGSITAASEDGITTFTVELPGPKQP